MLRGKTGPVEFQLTEPYRSSLRLPPGLVLVAWTVLLKVHRFELDKSDQWSLSLRLRRHETIPTF